MGLRDKPAGFIKKVLGIEKDKEPFEVWKARLIKEAEEKEAAKLTEGTDEIIENENIINQGAEWLGNKVIRGTNSPNRAYNKIKSEGAVALADKKVVKEELKAQADEAITGIDREAKKEMSIGDTSETYSKSIKDGLLKIRKRFKTDFDSIDLSHKGDVPLNQIDSLWKKLNRNHGGMKVDHNGDVTNTIATDIGLLISRAKSGEISVSKAIRKIRAVAGRMHHDNKGNFGAGEAKLKYADESLADFNRGIRNIFDEHVKRVGTFKKDPKFVEKARKIDKDYSEHFDIKNNKMINNAADYASKAQTQLDTKLNNPDRANIHFKEFKADWKKMGRAMNNPKFVEEQTIIYRDALSSRLFKEESPMFGNYMKSEDGLRLMKEMWPEHADTVQNFADLTRKANQLHGSISSWGSKVMGMGVMGGLSGTMMAGPLGGLLGSAISAGVAFGITNALKKPSFQKFVIKQFSKDPEGPKKSLYRLTKILKGDQEMAQKIIDTFPKAVGYTTAGGMALGGYELTKPNQSEQDASFDKKFGIQKKYKVDKSFDSKFGIIPE